MGVPFAILGQPSQDFNLHMASQPCGYHERICLPPSSNPFCEKPILSGLRDRMRLLAKRPDVVSAQAISATRCSGTGSLAIASKESTGGQVGQSGLGDALSLQP